MNRLFATPLTTLPARPRPRARERIRDLIAANEVTEIVIGLPLTMSGELGSQAQFIQDFGKELAQIVPQPIHYFDERLTTVAAERLMIELGLKPEQRKARIDEVAASIILQDFLDAQRGGILSEPPPPEEI
jgi:putative Holliday junction resolvase